MRGRPNVHLTEEDAIQFYVGIYYQELDIDPSLRHSIDKHIALIEKVNLRYQADIERNPKFNYEYYKDKFIECMEFITQVYAKKKSLEEKESIRKEFIKKLNL